MWGYMVGICMMINEEQQCQDQSFISDFSSQIACEVHSVLLTSLINYNLFHIDHVYDTWVAPTNCVDPSKSILEFFKELE